MRKWFIMKLKKIFIACSLLVGTVSSWAVNDNNLPIGESNAAVPTYVVINPNALAQNIKVMRQTIGSGVKICLVLKADAYGNGIANLINEAIKQNVEYIAAVDNSEFAIIAPAIKKSGKNIHMLRIAPVTKAELIEEITNGWNIEEVAGSVEEARMISTVAQEMSKKLHKKITIGVHLNIETGMGRMAVRDVSDMKQIIALPNLKLVGVMTHFARDYEDSPVDYEYTIMQLNMFEFVISKLNLVSDVFKLVADFSASLDSFRYGSSRCNHVWSRF